MADDRKEKSEREKANYYKGPPSELELRRIINEMEKARVQQMRDEAQCLYCRHMGWSTLQENREKDEYESSDDLPRCDKREDQSRHHPKKDMSQKSSQSGTAALSSSTSSANLMKKDDTPAKQGDSFVEKKNTTKGPPTKYELRRRIAEEAYENLKKNDKDVSAKKDDPSGKKHKTDQLTCHHNPPCHLEMRRWIANPIMSQSQCIDIEVVRRSIEISKLMKELKLDEEEQEKNKPSKSAEFGPTVSCSSSTSSSANLKKDDTPAKQGDSFVEKKNTTKGPPTKYDRRRIAQEAHEKWKKDNTNSASAKKDDPSAKKDKTDQLTCHHNPPCHLEMRRWIPNPIMSQPQRIDIEAVRRSIEINKLLMELKLEEEQEKNKQSKSAESGPSASCSSSTSSSANLKKDDGSVKKLNSTLKQEYVAGLRRIMANPKIVESMDLETIMKCSNILKGAKLLEEKEDETELKLSDDEPGFPSSELEDSRQNPKEDVNVTEKSAQSDPSTASSSSSSANLKKDDASTMKNDSSVKTDDSLDMDSDWEDYSSDEDWEDCSSVENDSLAKQEDSLSRKKKKTKVVKFTRKENDLFLLAYIASKLRGRNDIPSTKQN